MSARKSVPCSLCGLPVNRAGGLRKGLTAEHRPLTSEPGDGSQARCLGSDVAYSTHTRPKPVAPRRGKIWEMLGRLTGQSVTWVNFTEARVQRLLGHPTTGAAALKFVMCEIRVVACLALVVLLGCSGVDEWPAMTPGIGVAPASIHPTHECSVTREDGSVGAWQNSTPVGSDSDALTRCNHEYGMLRIGQCSSCRALPNHHRQFGRARAL